MTVVEQIARAIWAAREKGFSARVQRPTWDKFDIETGAVAQVMDEARAVLKALRPAGPVLHPMAHVLFAFKDGFDRAKDKHGYSESVMAGWNAVIDAALDEGSP